LGCLNCLICNQQITNVPVYHAAGVWEVSNKTTGKLVGLWYFDPYARWKRSGMNAIETNKDGWKF
jgi:Zn-dependent oligopeptidase